MATDGNETKQKISKKYCCETCDYSTERKSNIMHHFNTLKHINSTNGNKNKQNKQDIIEIYRCENCEKTYKDRTGLWKHKSKGTCKEQVLKNDDISTELIKLIAELVKGQNVLHESIVEICKNGTNNNPLLEKVEQKTYEPPF